MTLYRDLFTSRYGTFDRLMENIAGGDHGGYGDVTWNVGPHVGPNPYGPKHKIGFVDREVMMNFPHGHSEDEIQQHAERIGGEMDQDRVIHVPHVQFENGKPVMTAAHHGAVRAAAQRGAKRIPIVYNKKNLGDVYGHVDEIETPGGPAPGQGQDKNIKYRWNGKGWYTKPSFNKGRCPQGSQADSANDQCLGGGGAPGSAVGPEGKSALPPAEMWGSESRPAELRGGTPPPARRIIPRRAVRAAAPSPRPAAPSARGPEPKSDKNLPELLSKVLDRSQVPGAPVKLPPGYGLAYDTLSNRMDKAIGALDMYRGIRKKVKLEPEPGDTPENKLTKETILAARDEMLQKHPDTFRPGKFYGAGAAGAVFQGPEDPDGTPTVYKFDAGPYEARMAQAVMDAGLVGKNGLAILPRYISQHPTSQKFSKAGLPIHVIHREDLDDAKTGLSHAEMEVLGGYGASLGGLMQELQADANPRHAPPGVDPYDIGQEPSHPLFGRLGSGPLGWESKAGRGLNRKQLLQAYDRKIGRVRQAAQRAGGQLARQWDRIEAETRKLLEHGIVPCDLHPDNWGIRKGTGEISMRDAGCATVVEH